MVEFQSEAEDPGMGGRSVIIDFIMHLFAGVGMWHVIEAVLDRSIPCDCEEEEDEDTWH